jgi:hypothetical protein
MTPPRCRAVLGAVAFALPLLISASAASALVPADDSKAASLSVRGACKAAEAASADFQRANAVADEAGVDAAAATFARITKRAGDVPPGLRSQLRLVSTTLSGYPESPTTVRAARLFNARLVHGLTGIMLACDREDVRVTIEH